MQQIPPEWLHQLDDILSLLESQPEADQEERLLPRLAALDPDLLAFLIHQLAEQESPQAAAMFERLSGDAAATEAVRQQARAALDELARKGVRPPKPGEETFSAGFVQQGRERGEQILALSWRLPDGSLEAMVFLLDWRGDGLKDYYRTRSMSDGEWRELIAHNGEKGAAMVEVRLSEAKALVEAAIAEGRRFSRPLPRDYRLDAALVERRLLRATESPAPDAQRSFITPTLSPEEVVQAYVAALHHRDYALAALLMAPDSRLRAGRTAPEAAEALRLELKHAPRRESEVRTRLQTAGTEAHEDADQVSVEAEGTEVVVERSGKRQRMPVRETYRLTKVSQTWKVAEWERATQTETHRHSS